MASAFAHALFAFTIGKAFTRKLTSWKFWLLGMLCSVIPDADVIMFEFSVPYEHFLGHRGFSHSLVFAFLLAVLVTVTFYRHTKLFSMAGTLLVFYFFLCTVSHILLDAMTTGGLGVAVFSPFDNARYFLSWRPIKVSPIGVGEFIGLRGLRVLLSEFIWVGIPCLIFLLLSYFWRKTKGKDYR